MAQSTSAPPRNLGGILGLIERLGNKLPDPVFLFIGVMFVVMIMSAIGSAMGWRVQPQQPQVVLETVTAPDGTSSQRPRAGADGRPVLELVPHGSPITPRNLISSDGVYWLFANMIRNFLNFPPLGVVLVAMFGIGVAERVGLFGAAMKWLASLVPSRLLTPTVIFLGMLSHSAADAGYIILPPLAAALFVMYGRSPIAGIAAAFAGIGAGFSANFVVSATDALVSGITQTGAQTLDPTYQVIPTCNWWFMAVSAVLLTLVGWGVTAWVVEPRLAGRWQPGAIDPSVAPTEKDLSSAERRGLAWAGVGLLATVAVVGGLLFIPGAPLHGAAPAPAPRFGEIPSSPSPAPAKFVPGVDSQPPVAGVATLPAGYAVEAQGPAGRGNFRLADEAGLAGRLEALPNPAPRWTLVIVPLIFFVFLVPGLVYGFYTKAIKSQADISSAFIYAMSSMAPVIAMVFFAAQALECFRYSRLDTMLANIGGQALVAADLPPKVLLVALILLTLLINLMISSMSAKWAALSPIIVPMMMMVGISPELTQAAYRVGDSVTNVVTPLNAYIVVILAVAQRYDKDAGLGSILATMVPYSAAFFVFWAILMVVWVTFGVEIGPDAPLWYVPPSR
ncbi:p-aminobenzoyl-glutamate transport protein [Phycisphaerales bacterium]|nr:p-aminobenzoyl-glutamate transport protein [Phycisphaerales bacterium]